MLFTFDISTTKCAKKVIIETSSVAENTNTVIICDRKHVLNALVEASKSVARFCHFRPKWPGFKLVVGRNYF